MTSRFQAPQPHPECGSPRPVILFDGVCNLCHASVRWVIRRDPKAVFRFAPLQSPASTELLRLCRIGLPLSDELSRDPSAVFLIDPASGRFWSKSDAWIEIVKRLNAPWRWLSVLGVFPRGLRDAVYGFIAARRYRWFGKKESCPLPDPQIKTRFLE